MHCSPSSALNASSPLRLNPSPKSTSRSARRSSTRRTALSAVSPARSPWSIRKRSGGSPLATAAPGLHGLVVGGVGLDHDLHRRVGHGVAGGDLLVGGDHRVGAVDREGDRRGTGRLGRGLGARRVVAGRAPRREHRECHESGRSLVDRRTHQHQFPAPFPDRAGCTPLGTHERRPASPRYRDTPRPRDPPCGCRSGLYAGAMPTTRIRAALATIAAQRPRHHAAPSRGLLGLTRRRRDTRRARAAPSPRHHGQRRADAEPSTPESSAASPTPSASPTPAATPAGRAAPAAELPRLNDTSPWTEVAHRARPEGPSACASSSTCSRSAP